jgi:hypothetical protein
VPALALWAWHSTSTEVPKACFLLAGLLPLTLAPSLSPWWQRYHRKGLWAVQAILVLLPVAVAIYLAADNGSLDLSPGDDPGWTE